jgi:hypothetical protein
MTTSNDSLPAHPSPLAPDLFQGRRREQAEHSTNVASFCFMAMAAMIVASVLLGACQSAPAPKTSPAQSISDVKVIAAKPMWREWVQETVDCLHRAPVVPFDSLEWFEAPNGIPQSMQPAGPGKNWQCWAGMSFLATKAVVLSPWCSGESRNTVVHEALHVMYKSPSVLLETRDWWHDPKVFSKACGVIV